MDKQTNKNSTSEQGNLVDSPESKTREILILHFKVGMSAASIASIFSLSQDYVREKISNFSRQFSNRTYLMNVVNGLSKMSVNKGKQQSASGIKTDKDARIAELEQLLTEAQIRAEAYEEMMRLAEKTYGISIRKKAGAKQ